MNLSIGGLLEFDYIKGTVITKVKLVQKNHVL